MRGRVSGRGRRGRSVRLGEGERDDDAGRMRSGDCTPDATLSVSLAGPRPPHPLPSPRGGEGDQLSLSPGGFSRLTASPLGRGRPVVPFGRPPRKLWPHSSDPRPSWGEGARRAGEGGSPGPAAEARDPDSAIGLDQDPIITSQASPSRSAGCSEEQSLPLMARVWMRLGDAGTGSDERLEADLTVEAESGGTGEAAAWHGLGVLAAEPTAAVGAFRRAVAADPGSPVSGMALALALAASGQPDAAIEQARSVLQNIEPAQDPTEPGAETDLGGLGPAYLPRQVRRPARRVGAGCLAPCWESGRRSRGQVRACSLAAARAAGRFDR